MVVLVVVGGRRQCRASTPRGYSTLKTLPHEPVCMRTQFGQPLPSSRCGATYIRLHIFCKAHELSGVHRLYLVSFQVVRPGKFGKVEIERYCRASSGFLLSCGGLTAAVTPLDYCSLGSLFSFSYKERRGTT